MATRHTCAVCGSRKLSGAFPLGTSGSRVTATCSECLGKALRGDEAWTGLGLRADQNSQEGVQPAGVANHEDGGEASDTNPTVLESTRKRKRRNPTGYPPTKRRKQRKEPKPPPPLSATCRICVEEKDVSEFVRNARSRRFATAIPFECMAHLSHKINGAPNKAGGAVCKSCIGNSLAAGLESIGAENLACLEPDCTAGPWDYDYISQYLPAEALENYHEQMFTTFMATASTFKCLNATCGAVGLLEQTAPGFPNVVCSACSHRHCALCVVDWHEDMSCQAYRAKNQKALISAEEKTALRMLNKLGAKRCPRCQLAIEKDGGCNSMYCINCKRYFDWNTAEPVLGVSKKAAPLKQQPDYWREVCEADAPAAPLLPPPPPPPPPAAAGGLFGAADVIFGGLDPGWGAFQNMPLPDEDDGL